MDELIQEFVDSRGAAIRIDREAGVIHGVKVLGLESKNGRSYPQETLIKAASLYEGAKVNVNHPRGNPGGPRDYEERIGLMRSIEMRPGSGLFGNFHFNPKHPIAEQLLWDAEHAPENVGFSHNVEAKTGRGAGGRVIVEEITRVQSVDLVADPATTRGLFEQVTPTGKDKTLEVKDITEAMLATDRPDIVAAIKKMALTEYANSETEKAKDATIAKLTEEVGALKSAAETVAKDAAIAKELSEAKLPAASITDLFRQQLTEAKDGEARKALIEDRRKLTIGVSPKSAEQRTTEGQGGSANVTDVKSFVEAIT